MKLYALISDFDKTKLVEIEVIEKPNSFKVVDTFGNNVHRSVIRKADLGFCSYYDDVCFGLTKEQAIDGYVNSRKTQLQSLHNRIRMIELEVKEALEFKKEDETK